jgi:ComF family protein
MLYPRRCAGCGVASGEHGMHVCWECLADAVYVKDPFCSVCGDPVDGVVNHAFACSWCRRTHPSFAQARSAIRFRGAMKDVMHAFKYQNACYLATDLGGMLAGCVMGHFAAVGFDGIAYVPLHRRKGRERSYNQSRLLASDVGRRLGLPVLHRSLTRVRMTRTQTRLNAEERKRNVRGAFQPGMPEWTDGRRILLVDDVMTTGATVNECARVLMDTGARSVHVVTVARG